MLLIISQSTDKLSTFKIVQMLPFATFFQYIKIWKWANNDLSIQTSYTVDYIQTEHTVMFHIGAIIWFACTQGWALESFVLQVVSRNSGADP